MEFNVKARRQSVGWNAASYKRNHLQTTVNHVWLTPLGSLGMGADEDGICEFRHTSNGNTHIHIM